MLCKQLALDLREHLGTPFEIGARIVSTLTDALVSVAVPRTRFLDEAVFGAQVEHVAAAADSFSEEDIELASLERRGELVLDDLHAHAVSDRLLTHFDRTDTPDFEPL